MGQRPADGCLAESRAALYGDVQRWARVDAVPQILANTLRAQVKDAPSPAQGRARWRTCMSAAGFGYADPQAAKHDLTTSYSQQGKTPALRRREIAVATADGECARLSHLYATELQLRRDRAGTLPADQIRELDDLAIVHCSAYLKAQTVVGTRATATTC